MMYTLDELLMKMGTPETRERGQIRWHYFDRHDAAAGGFAEVRLLDGGATLVAELRQWRSCAIEGDPAGDDVESLYLHARRDGSRYAVTKIAFDGEEYPHPQKSVIELGLSIFHARALDISILMVEQAFNRDDIVHQPLPALPDNARVSRAPRVPAQEPGMRKAEAQWGVVVPFRPRSLPAALARH
ncbi:MAG: hypothetical protein KGL10_07625 [Alphaproteobacteria bacterium]|nr:hypothetical protein [Alphaproteobacteria bacterium]